jgi:hypothetical protein
MRITADPGRLIIQYEERLPRREAKIEAVLPVRNESIRCRRNIRAKPARLDRKSGATCGRDAHPGLGGRSVGCAVPPMLC